MASSDPKAADVARHVRDSLPEKGLFAGHELRAAAAPFPIDPKLARQL